MDFKLHPITPAPVPAAALDLNLDAAAEALQGDRTLLQLWLAKNQTLVPALYVLPVATADKLGGIKVGSGLSITADGTLSAAQQYILPTASASTLGGVKVGTGLAIDGNGVLSATVTVAQPNNQLIFGTGSGISSSSLLLWTGTQLLVNKSVGANPSYVMEVAGAASFGNSFAITSGSVSGSLIPQIGPLSNLGLGFLTNGVQCGMWTTDGKFLVGYITSQGSYVAQFNGGFYASGISTVANHLNVGDGQIQNPVITVKGSSVGDAPGIVITSTKNSRVSSILGSQDLSLKTDGFMSFKTVGETVRMMIKETEILFSLPHVVNSLASAPVAVTVATNGGSYYNSTTNRFQGYENGAWKSFVLQDSTGAIVTDSFSIKSSSNGATFLSWNGFHAYSNPGGGFMIGGTSGLNGYDKLMVVGNANVSGNLGVGRVANAGYVLDVVGQSRITGNIGITGELRIGILATPTASTPTAAAGGSLAAGTYYAKIVAIDAAGNSLPSTEVLLTVNGTTQKSINFTWSAVTNATSYRIYVGTATGAQNRYFTATLTNYTMTAYGAGDGSVADTVPTVNTSGTTSISSTGVKLFPIATSGVAPVPVGAIRLVYVDSTGQLSYLTVDQLPIYADNTAAASLSTSTIYRTAAGALMIKL